MVGGGDTAMEESMYLSGICSSVTLVHRREEFRASKAMQDRVLKNPKIKIVYNVVGRRDARRIEGRGHRRAPQEHQDQRDARGPDHGPLRGHRAHAEHRSLRRPARLHDNGYIKTRPGSSYTNVPGVFACGDVQDFTYRQAVTAAGTGCMAALDAERWMAVHDPH